MTHYKCIRCGYNTSHKGHFKSHLRKKIICSPKISNVDRTYLLKQLDTLSSEQFSEHCEQLDRHCEQLDKHCEQLTRPKQSDLVGNIDIYTCKYCDKPFKNATSKYRHQRDYCKQSNTIMPVSEKNKDEKIEELTTQVHGLLQMLMETSINKSDVIANSHNTNNNQTNITNNNITQNNQLQINNQINNYGKEDTSYITKEKYKEILKNPFSSLSKLINEIHFNDEHPENKNMQIPNKKQPFVEFYDDGWVIGNQYKFVCKLFFVKKELLHKAYLEVEDMLDEKTKEAYRYFREETTLNPRTVESQLKDIQAAIMSGTRRRKEYLLKSQTTNTTTIINAIET